jgi:hypothetical protein
MAARFNASELLICRPQASARRWHSLDDFLGVADLQMETHLRIADVEGRHEGRQEVGADRVAGADRELAAFEIGEFADRALCRFVAKAARRY